MKFIDKKESIAIAGVNTTLFALLIASVSVYLAFVHTSVQQIEVKTFAEAAQINNLDFIINDSAFGGLDKQEILDPDKLDKMMSYIILGADDPTVPKDLEARAEKALGIMKAWVNHYPFPELSFKNEESSSGTRDKSMPVSFENLKEVQKWIDSMNKIFRVFSTEIMGDGQLLPLLRQYDKSQTASDRKEIFRKAKLPQKKVDYGYGRSLTLEGLDLEKVYHDYRKKCWKLRAL